MHFVRLPGVELAQSGSKPQFGCSVNGATHYLVTKTCRPRYAWPCICMGAKTNLLFCPPEIVLIIYVAAQSYACSCRMYSCSLLPGNQILISKYLARRGVVVSGGWSNGSGWQQTRLQHIMLKNLSIMLPSSAH